MGRNSHVVASLPPLDPQGQFLLIPVMVLATRFVKRNNVAVGQWLVQCAHSLEEEGTWEFADEMIQKFPNLKP